MLRLYLANKNYSSWSLRAWLVLSRCGVTFEEVLIPLDRPDTASRIRAHSPSGRMPALVMDKLLVWDSLAIAETLAEHFPTAKLWPVDANARAEARAVSAEMHSGFAALRRELPMNIRARRRVEPGDDARADILRIQQLWSDCRASYNASGPWLFGSWSIADAMYAPVVTRFLTYGIAGDAVVRAYASTVLADPALVAWSEAAKAEPETVAADETGSAVH